MGREPENSKIKHSHMGAKIYRLLLSRKFTDVCVNLLFCENLHLFGENLQVSAKIYRFLRKKCRFSRKFADFCENLRMKICKLAKRLSRGIFGFLDFGENAETNDMLSFLEF